LKSNLALTLAAARTCDGLNTIKEKKEKMDTRIKIPLLKQFILVLLSLFDVIFE